MKEAIHESEVITDNYSRVIRSNRKDHSDDLKVISYDMHSADIYKVLEVSTRAYIEAKEKNGNYLSEEQFYMSAAQAIANSLTAENITESSWQVIIGQNYGSFVTHESFYFINFKYDEIWFTIYVSS